MNCRAYNEHFILNTWYVHASHSRLPNAQLRLPTFKGTAIWQPFHHSLQNFSKIQIPHELSHMKEIPIKVLISKLQQLQQLNDINVEPYAFHTWGYIAIGANTALGSGATLLLYCTWKGKNRFNTRKTTPYYRSANRNSA